MENLVEQEREMKGQFDSDLTRPDLLMFRIPRCHSKSQGKSRQNWVIREVHCTRNNNGTELTLAQRRETLKRLIDAIHSPHINLKMLAAQNIRFFFIDFPELEEAAINAVYDLCEDQSSKVLAPICRNLSYTVLDSDRRLLRHYPDIEGG